MDRESFDVSVQPSGDDWPLLRVDATDAGDVVGHLAGPGESGLPAEDVDVTYREIDGGERGVLGVSNRLTGAFLLEAPLAANRVAALVEAVLETKAADDGHYRLEIVRGGEVTSYDEETLLVYDAEGNLLRARSLIPGGVEL
jgi:hypothetical protein